MRRMMRPAVIVTLALISVTVPALGQRVPALSPEEQAVEAFVRMVNGKWVLAGRVNPGGGPQSQVKGWLAMDLVRQQVRMVGPRALGRFNSEEHGTLDRESFFLESAGLWEVTLDHTSPAPLAANETPFVVAQAISVRASGGACRDGLLSQVDLRLRMLRPDAKTAATPTLFMAKPASPGLSRTFRGRAVPAEWAAPVTFANTAVRSADTKVCSREFADLAIAGAEMRITWDNGVRDVLRRAAAR